MGDKEAGKSGTVKNETEKSEYFEKCNQKLQFTPYFHVKVTDFRYKHPNFTRFTHSGNRLQMSLINV